MAKLILVTGGTRSGKSGYALKLAESQRRKIVYIATAVGLDSEMKKRIALHKKTRRKDWTTIEEPSDILKAVKKISERDVVVILDCLTLLLSNLMLKGIRDGEIFDRIKSIAGALKKSFALSIIVTNEVGSGIVPENKPARRFRDLQGRANQIVSQEADCVYLLVSGVPVKIK